MAQLVWMTCDMEPNELLVLSDLCRMQGLSTVISRGSPVWGVQLLLLSPHGLSQKLWQNRENLSGPTTMTNKMMSTLNEEAIFLI
jgi:hypothetical protein